MSFPRQLLNVDEEVVLDVHPHWLFFTEPVLMGLGLLVLAIILAATVGSGILTDLALIGVVVALAWGLWRLVTWRSTHFVITSDRLIYRSGVLAKRGIQIPVERVNNVNFKQGILERMLGAGDLLVESAGENGQQRGTLSREEFDAEKHRLLGTEAESPGQVPGPPLPPPTPGAGR
jgi:uncharacterized membrane protein YdbT with pleckstrin-like domain